MNRSHAFLWVALVAACSNPPANPDVPSPTPDAIADAVADTATDIVADRASDADAALRDDAQPSDAALDVVSSDADAAQRADSSDASAQDAAPDSGPDADPLDASDAAPDVTLDAQSDGAADVDGSADASADSSDGGCGLCMSGATCCAGRCVNLRTDPQHCGACGVPCIAGAMAYYDFNEGSGTSFLERASGMTFTHNARYATGVRGAALEFDGTNSGQATTGGWTFTGSYTWTFWIYPTGTNGDWSVIYHRGAHNLERQSAMFFIPTSYRLHNRSGTMTDWNAGCDSAAALAANRWSFVALVHDAAGVRVFIDGVQTCTAAIAAPVDSTGPLYLGDSPWFPGMQGRLDEFRVFNRALTLTELTAVRALQ